MRRDPTNTIAPGGVDSTCSFAFDATALGSTATSVAVTVVFCAPFTKVAGSVWRT